MLSREEEKFLAGVRRTVGLAVNRYGLISAGDRVLVAISGGKDSFVLLETLASRRKYLPIHYELVAVHVKVTGVPYAIDEDYYSSFCEALGVNFFCRTIVPDFSRDPEKSTCFLCSWHRRKVLFSLMKEMDCTRLALGHHMDDAIATLVLNMAYQGAISSMPPRLSMFSGEFDLIRPLILLQEDELRRYAKLREFPVQKAECPFGEKNRRSDAKRIAADWAALSPRAKKNIFASMSNIHKEYLPE